MFLKINLIQFRTEFKKVAKMPHQQTMVSLMNEWPTWQKKIIAYSTLEMTNRPKLKSLVQSLKGPSDNDSYHNGKKKIIMKNYEFLFTCS